MSGYKSLLFEVKCFFSIPNIIYPGIVWGIVLLPTCVNCLENQTFQGFNFWINIVGGLSVNSSVMGLIFWLLPFYLCVVKAQMYLRESYIFQSVFSLPRVGYVKWWIHKSLCVGLWCVFYVLSGLLILFGIYLVSTNRCERLPELFLESTLLYVFHLYSTSIVLGTIGMVAGASFGYLSFVFYGVSACLALRTNIFPLLLWCGYGMYRRLESAWMVITACELQLVMILLCCLLWKTCCRKGLTRK